MGDDVHEALTRAGAAKVGEASSGFPIQSWDKYSFVLFLGEGGMGHVYKAYDPALKRNVALKFIRGDDPLLRKRFLQEAQSQARIDHKNVCKVYEAGEVEGKFYIAMQYIDGKTLNKVVHQLTLEQKVKIIKEAAEGLNAAHRIGLIHRDIKPGNIMIEKTEEGWHPYILDFGLVREVTAKGLTVSGMLIGTPQYMAPEQAWGDVEKLDRRVDVYSLGATFYELLCGNPPLDAPNTMEVLRMLMDEEPRPLRQLSSTVPEDLEKIIMKCLEKEPSRRYESARSLADDLQRYLDGEPVQARRASISYRMMKKARKHKAVVGVSVVAVFLILLLLVLAVRSEINSRRRAELAQRFGQQVEKIENIMRLSHISPLHDVRREKEIVRSRMKSIQAQMDQLGDAAEASGHYAMGRGYLSLNDLQNARTHLQLAWDNGYQEPQTAYALGLALGRIYELELEAARRLPEESARRIKEQELAKEFGEPAAQLLAKSSNYEEASSSFVRGLIHFYGGRYDAALQSAGEALRHSPWLYEANILKGRIYNKRGREKEDRGLYDGAREDYRLGSKSLEDALQTGESDPNAYEGLCTIKHQWIHMELFQTGGDVTPIAESAIQACKNAIAADPEMESAYLRLSRVHSFLAKYEMDNGKNPSASISDAIRAAEESVKIGFSAQSRIALSNAYRFQSEYELYYGGDPRHSIDKMIHNLELAAKSDPRNMEIFGNLGQAFLIRGEYQIDHGENPGEALNLSIKNYQKAVEINPRGYGSFNSMANAYGFKADFELTHGIDPEESLKGAIKNYQKAIELNPKYTHAYNNLGTAFEARGKYEMSSGKDPTSSFEEAAKLYRKTIELNPNYQHPYINLAVSYRYLAEYEILQGRDASRIIQSALKELDHGLTITQEPFDLVVRSEINLIRARNDLRFNRSPESALNEQRKDLQKAAKQDPQYPGIDHGYGSAELFKAKWKMDRKLNASTELSSAETYLRKAAEVNRLDPVVLTELAEVYLLQSTIARENSEALRLADEGLESIEQALKQNPHYADAYLLRGKLHLQKAKLEPSFHNLKIIAGQDLKKALQLNQNLKNKD